MNDKPLVSVIVPCYKKAVFLPETLNSVLAQSFRGWECIIVDDGSPDNTKEVVTEFINKDSRFHYLYQDNAGVAKARNNGIAHSSGKYIFPLDADDLITPDCLEEMVTYFEGHQDTTLVTCVTQKFGAVSSIYNLPDFDYSQIIWGNQIVNSSLYKHEDFDKTTGYNPNMIHGYEDWDFWLSLLKPDSIVYRIQKPLFLYRTQAASRAVSNNSMEHWIASHRQIYLNHPEIYSQYVPEIIILHNKEQELKHVLNSKAYKLGERIARIFRKLYYRH